MSKFKKSGKMYTSFFIPQKYMYGAFRFKGRGRRHGVYVLKMHSLLFYTTHYCWR